MNTPIVDFVRRYRDDHKMRLHMPGHKGQGPLGVEELDITEISGADSLYEAAGIIRESEENASALFGCPTFYSTEGSSQCIRAMLYLAMIHAKTQGKKPVIAAGRNAHKVFLSAVALLDLDVNWLVPDQQASYLSCPIGPEYLDTHLTQKPATAVYITSPDYLGNVADIAALSAVCRRHGALLLVDNAHGAYLRFMNPSRHPMDLGADLCCDSAHKTLPVLTGGAYLHVASPALASQAKHALGIFGSTSPSYLILQSLDGVNPRLAGDYPLELACLCRRMDALKAQLRDRGYDLLGQEPLKLTIRPKSMGYTGIELGKYLEEADMVCEFSDPDHLVLMMTPEITKAQLDRLAQILTELVPRTPVFTAAPPFHQPQRVLSIREALLSPGILLPVEECVGRTLQAATVGCPPAVPIVVSGERIDQDALAVFAYYGIDSCAVIQS